MVTIFVLKMSAKNRWQAGGGKAITANRALNQIQVGPPQVNLSVTDEQFQRAKTTFVGLFLLMVTVWSTVLISSIFALRVNLESCENCPESCQCRAAAPAWG